MICAENPSVSCIKTWCLTSRINILYLSQSFMLFIYIVTISNNILIVRTKNNVTSQYEFFSSFICIDHTQPSFVKTKFKQVTFTLATEFNSFCCSFLSCVLSFPCDMLLYIWLVILWLSASVALLLLLCNVSHSCISLCISLMTALFPLWLRCTCHLLLSFFLLCG